MAAARGNRSNTNTAGNLDPYRVPWFADCAPSLLTNRTIRRYLNAYSQHAWPEVIKLTLIYGVLGLEQQFPGGTLSIPQLRQLVEKGGAQLVVQRNLPGLQRQILDLQTNLDAVFDRLAVEPPPVAAPGAATTTHAQAGAPQQQQQQAAAALPAQLAQRAQQQQQQQVLEFPKAQAPSARPVSATLNPGPVASKPPDQWRLGEKTGFPSPPRAKDHPLRRSLDNQGATNPIYPDWWMAAGPPAPPARKVAPQKAPRKQPRLAYSVQQQQQQPQEAGAVTAAADDLVTAEYLMVPGSGYGQGVPAPVVAGADPPLTVTRITADSMQTNPLFDAAQQLPAAAAATVAGAGVLASRGGVTAAAGAGRGASRRPQAAQSKIREMVAASRRKAAAQQRRRQQLLASAVAAGSSLFGDAPQQQQQQQVPSRAAAAAAEAVAACAPAAAAEHFLSNPWTACFLQPSAVRPDVLSFTGLPAADITADDEGRLGALADEGGNQLQMGKGEALGQPTAPAAYAVLQRVVAGGDALPSAVADGGVGGSVDLLGVAGGGGQVHQEVGLQQQPEAELQQEQVGGLLAAGPSTQTKGAAAAGAHAGSSRGVFADITSGLNSQGAAAAGGGGAFASWGHPQLGPQLEAAVAAEAAREASQQSVDDRRNLPLVGEEEQESHLQSQQQQQRQRQQQQPREAWVQDYGHLEGVQPPPAARTSAAGREGGRAAGRPHKRWNETWVGDFGHLQQFPRFARDTAFQHEREAAGDAAAAGGGSSRPPSKLFMSPADLQAMVAAADRLQSQPALAAGSQSSPNRPDSAGLSAAGGSSAAGAGRGGGWEAGATAGTAAGPSSEATAAGIEGSSSSAHRDSLAARFAELLCRWDTQAADRAGELPAGVAARAQVEHVASSVRAVAPAEGVAAGQQAVIKGAAAEDTASTTSSSSSYNTAGSDAEGAAADTEQQPSRLDASAALDVAAADAAALLLNLQQAVSELSAATTDSQAAGVAAGAVAPAAFAAAADEEDEADLAAGAGEAGGALGVSLPAESHLDGMQEASQMLQQALSRHDALMQLIASLGGAPGSDNTLLESLTASGSELTV